MAITAPFGLFEHPSSNESKGYARARPGAHRPGATFWEIRAGAGCLLGLGIGFIDGENHALEEIASVRMADENVNYREKQTPAPAPI